MCVCIASLTLESVFPSSNLLYIRLLRHTHTEALVTLWPLASEPICTAQPAIIQINQPPEPDLTYKPLTFFFMFTKHWEARQGPPTTHSLNPAGNTVWYQCNCLNKRKFDLYEKGYSKLKTCAWGGIYNPQLRTTVTPTKAEWKARIEIHLSLAHFRF